MIVSVLSQENRGIEIVTGIESYNSSEMQKVTLFEKNCDNIRTTEDEYYDCLRRSKAASSPKQD